MFLPNESKFHTVGLKKRCQERKKRKTNCPTIYETTIDKVYFHWLFIYFCERAIKGEIKKIYPKIFWPKMPNSYSSCMY